MIVQRKSCRTDDWNRFILEGNLDALSRVYYSSYDLLFNYGLRLTADRQIVEDAIQNVFLSLMKSRKSISQVKNPTGYLVSSFRHQLFSDINQQNKTVLSENFSDDQFDYFKSADLEPTEKEKFEILHSKVRECITHLTPKQQEILFLRFETGISYEEISALLNISVDSCYKSVYRSIRIVRDEVAKLSNGSQDLILWFLAGFSLHHRYSNR
ncbi:MAG: sigma-70 family RNA polymerase sigma factor [Prolixibacteraceae bacterium]|nr:sigma-70 family RNA polymerase sigma factor [Prolixibacteraceae bacterium]